VIAPTPLCYGRTMQPTVLLKPANPEDYGLALELYLTTMQPYTAKLMTWDDSKRRRSFATQWNVDDAVVIVVGGSDAGWAQIKEFPSEILLQQIFVAPAHQRQGIGTETIRQLLARFGKKRKPIVLTVLKNNPARRLYERLGFSVVGEIGVKFVMRRDAATCHGNPLSPS
jgi:ribosomal protein S18 acetylase RimI-like enzyme